MALGTDDDGVAEADFLDELANEAVIDILSRTRVHVRLAQVLLNQGDAQFEFDESLLRVIGLSRAGSDGSQSEMFEGDRDALGSNEYSWPGFNRILLGTTAGASDTIFFWYTPQPLPMTDDSQTPSAEEFGNIPVQFHRAILNYMMWHAADKAGDQAAGRGERYRILYEGRDGLAGAGSDLGRIKIETNMRGTSMRIKRDRPLLRGDMTPRFWQG
jgi:hypothetical protein